MSLSGKAGRSEPAAAALGLVNASKDGSTSRDKNGLVAQKEMAVIRSAGGGTLKINIYGDGSMNIKGAAERTKATLVEAGAGKGNTKDDRVYNVLVAADRDTALGMAREIGLTETQQMFVERSDAWNEEKPNAL